MVTLTLQNPKKSKIEESVMMRKVLLSALMVSCVLPSGAMEEIRAGIYDTKQKPLRFQIDNKTGQVEDAKGSNLIYQYRAAVGGIEGAWGAFIEEANDKLKAVDLQIEGMKEGSIERVASEIYRRKIVKKIEKLRTQRRDIFDVESVFQKLMKAVIGPVVLGSQVYSGGFAFAVPNYATLEDIFCKDFDADFSQSQTWDAGGPVFDKLGKDMVAIVIKSNLPSSMINLHSSFYGLSGKFLSKLDKISKDVMQRASVIYHIQTKTESCLTPLQSFLFTCAAEKGKLEGTNAAMVLNEEIQDLKEKAQHQIIPLFAPFCFMASAIKALQEDAPRLREALLQAVLNRKPTVADYVRQERLTQLLERTPTSADYEKFTLMTHLFGHEPSKDEFARFTRFSDNLGHEPTVEDVQAESARLKGVIGRSPKDRDYEADAILALRFGRTPTKEDYEAEFKRLVDILGSQAGQYEIVKDGELAKKLGRIPTLYDYISP
jgi:hypothetical protein